MNKLIITLNVNEFLIIVMLRQEQNREIYTEERLFSERIMDFVIKYKCNL
jgi:hypothetical protein